MNATEMLEKIGGTLGSSASVKSVFGEPIEAGGKTIVPVAHVAYGFGGGFGTGKQPNGADRQGEGGGGGGRVHAHPAGVLEITEANTRYIPFIDFRLMTFAVTVGALFGLLLVGRRR